MAVLDYIPGNTRELGVSRLGKNTNFAVAIGDTDEVCLKLYKNATDTTPEHVLRLTKEYCFGNVFAVTIKNFVGKGYTYMYEAKGVSFIDPYAKLLSGREHYGKYLNKNAKKLIRAYVNENPLDMSKDVSPSIEFQNLIIYKLHVRGFTKNAGGSHKGTYRGIIDKIPYLTDLGINAVLLMPCMEYNEVYDAVPEVGVPEFVSSKFFKGNAEIAQPDRVDPLGASPVDLPYLNDEERKINYWGYTSFYHFFAPKSSYANDPSKADAEFKQMVLALHKAGIEVLMEVSIPRATNRSMMLDALRFWVREYHVDGFKLNLDCIDSSLIACDPYLSQAKLIGSGWNTDEIYPVEYTPDTKRLAVYNDGFSTDIRRFLKSDEGMSGAVINQITDNKGKTIKVNYITDHNGFTLSDLYMYDIKHNEANGEQNRDGTDVNYSWNCGAEGPDKSKKVKALRLKMRKNAMASLLLSQGVPLIYSGDEFGNTQEGNNNAYCQDNEIGWISWKKQRSEKEFFEFVKELIKIRKAHPVLHNKVLLKSMDYLNSGIPDVSMHSSKAWFPDNNFYNRCIAVLYCGDYALVDRVNKDKTLYLIFNMYWDNTEYELPHGPKGTEWKVALATDGVKQGEIIKDKVLNVPGRSVILLESTIGEKIK